MKLVGNGLTTSDAKTKQRISANVVVKSDSDLNSTVASSVPGDGADVGYAFFNCGEGAGTITLTKDGYKTRVERVTFPIPTNIDYAMEPIGAPVSPLHLEKRGNDFVNANGQRIVFAGLDGFDDLFFRVNGNENQLDALMVESRQIGFTVRRIWCMGDAGENQVFSLYPQNVPGYFDLVRGLVAYENQRGSIPLLTCFVDAQRVMPNQGQRQAFWRDLNEALLGSGLYLMSAGNEAFKNGFDPVADISDPGHGVIWSRGSDQEDVTPITNAPATELHATRNSFDRALMDSTASPPYMRSKGAKMVWMTEGNPFGDGGGYTPEQAWKLGRGYSIDWALAVHHNRQSQRGQLMHADTAETAAQWVSGMRLG